MAAGCHQRSDAPTCSPSAARDVTTGDVVPGMVGCVVDRARRLKRPRSGSRSTPRRSARGATGSSPTVSTVSTTVPAELARHRTRQPPRWRGEWSHLRRRHQEALPASARAWLNGSAHGRHDRPLHPAASVVRAPTWRSVLMSRTGVVSPRSTPPSWTSPRDTERRARTSAPNHGGAAPLGRARSASRCLGPGPAAAGVAGRRRPKLPGAGYCRDTTGAVETTRRLHTSVGSGGADVLGFFTLATGADLELDSLAFGQSRGTNLQVGDVHEHVVAAISGDETESSVVVEELHCALHDATNLSLSADPSGWPTLTVRASATRSSS